MHLIQMLLPVTDNGGRPLGRKHFDEVKRELTRKFRGLTAYSRAPAEGLWKPRHHTKRDQIVVYEVMTPSLSVAWWKRYKKRLEKSFRQDSIVIRAQPVSVF